MKDGGWAVSSPRWLQAVALLVAIALLTGCAAQKAFTRGEREMRREEYDQAVLAYSKAVALKPGKTRYAVALERAKLRASSIHFEKGQRYFNSGQLDLAIAEFQQTLLLSPSNQHAENEDRRQD